MTDQLHIDALTSAQVEEIAQPAALSEPKDALTANHGPPNQLARNQLLPRRQLNGGFGPKRQRHQPPPPAPSCPPPGSLVGRRLGSPPVGGGVRISGMWVRVEAGVIGLIVEVRLASHRVAQLWEVHLV